MKTYDLFAVTAPGLEVFTAREIDRLFDLKTESLYSKLGQNIQMGGISFKGDISAIYKANLWLRTANRVLIRFGKFYAAAFSELQKKSSRLPWEEFLRPGEAVTIRVTCHKSRLYHSDAVAERIVTAIKDRLGQTPEVIRSDDTETPNSAQLIIIRIVRDLCTISLDTSGEHLHKRGYRPAVAKAPLRETSAAAMLIASEWDHQSILIDPFCGAGTIPIEAAMISASMPPGGQRQFRFMSWKNFQHHLWEKITQIPERKASAAKPIIFASDRDQGAVNIAVDNAVRAKVDHLIHFECRVFSNTWTGDAGWIVTNPPYGQRIQSNQDIRNLYAQLGKIMLNHYYGWRFAILTSDKGLLNQIGQKMNTDIKFDNGGIPVILGLGKSLTINSKI